MARKTLLLLVDDSEDDIILAGRALRSAAVECDLVVTRSGAEALDYLFGHGAHAARDAVPVPNLILLDVKLPGLSGFEVLEHIRLDERTRLIPVVMLSSSYEDHDVAESYRRGANGYVRKPIDFVEFREVVRKLAQYWLEWNVTP